MNPPFTVTITFGGFIMDVTYDKSFREQPFIPLVACVTTYLEVNFYRLTQ